MQDYFFIRQNHQYIKIRIADILFIESCGNYTILVMEKKSFMLLVTMSQMEDMLTEFDFLRVHRSYLIALAHVDSFDNEAVHIKDKTIPVGRFYKNRMKEKVKIVVGETREYQSVKMAKLLIAKGA